MAKSSEGEVRKAISEIARKQKKRRQPPLEEKIIENEELEEKGKEELSQQDALNPKPAKPSYAAGQKRSYQRETEQPEEPLPGTKRRVSGKD